MSAGVAQDRDTREVTASLRDAVRRSRLSQAGFARAVGTSPSRLSTYLRGGVSPSARFVVRAARLGHALGEAAQHGLMSSPVTAASIRAHQASTDTAWRWRMLLQGRDHLQLMFREDAPGTLVDSWEARPGGSGSAGWDALLAAVARNEFDLGGREAPEWTCGPALTEEWMPDHPFLSSERVRAQTPPWLRELNILVPARDLVTA